tara:strand:+ start:2534 stop:2707 length:174 start_codon:yes stop_codon:yes gene_type:complete
MEINKMKKILIALVSLTVLSGCVSANSTQKYKTTSYEHIKQDADSGNLDAQFELAKA